ncbi:MAG: heavy-metal-associated domain-containing protein [Anaerolineae bacterium]
MHHCQAMPVEKTVCADEQAAAQMARLLVWGLVCPNCAVRVRNALLALDGVVSADVDWERGLAFVDYLPDRTNAHALARQIMQAGNDVGYQFNAAVI